MNKLRNLFAFAVIATLGGGLYVVAILKPSATIADAVDAGLLKVSTPAHLSCRVRINPACTRADGGPWPAYARVEMRARIVTGTTPDTLLIDPPNSPDGGECFRLVGTPSEACDFVEDAGCTDPAVCNANAPPRPEQEACACRRTDAGLCRVPTLPDAGGLVLAPVGATIQPPWIGQGCFRKYCGPVSAGEATADWPAECPQ